MIVIDPSVLANVVGDDGPAGRAARDRISAAAQSSAPDLVDVETVSVSCPLVTADRRLARAPGIRCDVDILMFSSDATAPNF